jgi:hypothetical protein
MACEGKIPACASTDVKNRVVRLDVLEEGGKGLVLTKRVLAKARRSWPPSIGLLSCVRLALRGDEQLMLL